MDGHRLAYRPEPAFDGQDGRVFHRDPRIEGWVISVEAPFDARGITVFGTRYRTALAPSAAAKDDDVWVYQPEQRRVRRLASPRRGHAISGTDFGFADFGSFSGIVPQYEWQCLGRHDLLAPMNARRRAHPYERDLDLGPSGLSYANERFELRHALKLRMTPRDADHPYAWKNLYVDEQTFEPMYAFAYDRSGALWKVIWHDHRWSDEPGNTDYEGWEGVPEPRDLTVVSDAITNVQAGSGVRIDFFDRDGAAEPSAARIRRSIDVGFLTKCR